MGNKLYVDSKVSEINDLISFDMNMLDNCLNDNDIPANYQNLKVWSFKEDSQEHIQSTPILLPNVKEDHFLLSSYEAYIILLVYKGKGDLSEISSFPTSLWGIVESSSNMTPRGLMYEFSSSTSQNLESYLLSKRDFENSDYKYVLFIWNGKNCSPLSRSYALMRAFELDKKLSDPTILPYLYSGYFIKDKNFQKGTVLNLNEIIKNTLENINEEDVLPTPSSETIFNYRETVYLLKWLYPNKKENKMKTSRKNILCKKFNLNFLSNTTKNYYESFLKIEKTFTRSRIHSERNDDVKELDKNRDRERDLDEMRECDMSRDEEYEEDMDIVQEDNLQYTQANKFTLKSGIPLAKIDLGNIYNKTSSSADTDNNSDKVNVSEPKLVLSFQHKILNEEIITQRTKQMSQDEEKLENLPGCTIKKSSDTIMKGLKKIDVKSLNTRQDIKQLEGLRDLVNYDPNDDANDSNDYIRESERRQLVMDYFSKTISEIIPDFLYLSSYNVAKNKEIVYKNKITHIINTAADFCQNPFEEDLSYLSYNMKDHAIENIECLFYEVIAFIDKAKEKGGRVLVHCIQGISRSVTLVLAYLIFKEKLNYEQAFKIVQGKRSISSPNLGFSIQLQTFYQRLYEPSVRLLPKVFAIGSFQPEQPDKIVSRLLNEQLFESRGNNMMTRVFDKRGLYVIAIPEVIYVWIGSRISPNLSSLYWSACHSCIENLQKYEHAPKDVIQIKEGQENYNFLKIWFNSDEKMFSLKTRMSDIIPEWNNWYKEFDISAIRETKLNSKLSQDRLNEENTTQINNANRKAFYIYPDTQGESLFDLDDLNEKVFLIACYENLLEEKYSMHVWKGALCDEAYGTYIEEIKNNFFSKEDVNKVEIIEEAPYNESDEFMNLL